MLTNHLKMLTKQYVFTLEGLLNCLFNITIEDDARNYEVYTACFAIMIFILVFISTIVSNTSVP